ncbi:hypothetical protein M413DRAFT_446173 [Hebeloma cylindrosporum]|uniref:Uncharacterized protein n=1 Tax=Hebeloma cylindrosporum TaxID=76867 RepID=A0A0C2YIB3_HEBCY|nr:hypothetical protein M413DRAFT_446173 [Hebeloma cylindrosporum h7]
MVEVASPVHNFALHRDILWNIFMLNADMDASTSPDLPYSSARGTRQFVFSTLTVLRCSSQVCQLWRSIILEAPSLWSRVIDLDILQISTLRWREAVMERTGKAPLHVKGRVSKSGDQSLFVWIISRFGARIRNLDVAGVPNAQSLTSAISFLQNPAPCLESFKLQFDSFMPLGDPNLPPFANNAPFLRSYFHTGIDFSIETPWLSNLCNLYLCSHIGLSGLLEILSRTPRLEFLKVERGVLDDSGSAVPLRHVILASLKEINIYDHILMSILLLDNIIPAAGCRLCLRTPDHSGSEARMIMKSDTLTMMEGVFCRYIQYYFASSAPRHLSLEIGRDAVVISARVHPTQNGVSPDFVLSASCEGGFWQDFLQALLSPFLSCELKRVTHLDLVVAHRLLGRCDTNIRKLLISLTNVHRLHTTASTLEILSEYNRPVFPSLHTISFRYFIPGSPKAVYGFLSSRKKFGASTIHTLDFTRSNAPELYFLSFLRHLPDMEILPKGRDIREDEPVSEDCDMNL